VCFNLAVLGYWKYTAMLLRTLSAWQWRSSCLLRRRHWRELGHSFGISFYAFTGIAYMVDVYRRSVPAETSLWRVMLHMTFFPHLMAGPILRRGNSSPDCTRRMPERPEAPWRPPCWWREGTSRSWCWRPDCPRH
jgi:D-alanyl-lipoteichoic acid acyltransferase DltB (MBOAT superfamily)